MEAMPTNRTRNLQLQESFSFRKFNVRALACLISLRHTLYVHFPRHSPPGTVQSPAFCSRSCEFVAFKNKTSFSAIENKRRCTHTDTCDLRSALRATGLPSGGAEDWRRGGGKVGREKFPAESTVFERTATTCHGPR